MLTTLNEVLPEARSGGYALPAFDCVEDVMVRAVLETLESLRTPAIIMCLVGPDLEGNGWKYVPGLVKAVADCHDIPVVLQLDHSRDLEEIKRAVDEGFSSVMYDGSALPFEENVRLTREAVEIAHPHGVTVEGELGYVGGADLAETQHTENVLTERAEVVAFIEQTNVDALAVSIGTAHGVYKAQPSLNIERLVELNADSSVPLVLHGGSGTPDEQIRDAVKNGISKVNIYADNRIAMGKGLARAAAETSRPDPLPRDVFRPMHDEIAAVVTEKVDLLGARGRV